MYKIVAGLAVCFFLFIVWIIYSANTGSNNIFFYFIRSIPNGDKFGHAGLFGFVTFVSIISLKFSSLRLGKIGIYYGAIMVLLFVVGEELSQAFIPSRTFDLVDLVADAIGIMTASCICFVGKKYITKNSNKDLASDAT